MHIVIIGNGIAGITAARTIRKLSNHRITVISGETEHFFSRTALMYIYMGHMKFEHTKPYEDWFWKKNNIDLVFDWVLKISSEEKQLLLQSSPPLSYDKLIIASGSKPNKFGWPGQDAQGVQGLYSFQDLELMETNSEGLKHAVIVGGGLIGIEMAEMFHSRNIPVTLLVREPSYWNNVLPKEESEMINREIRRHHIDLRLSTELKEINPDSNGRVKAITTNQGESIECQFVGLTAGVSPNISFLEESGIETAKGVLINEYFETNQADIYAIGDCAQFKTPPKGRRPIEQVWYTGRMHGETLGHSLCKQKVPYQPGPWFNSAKFFNIEYQTYGDVPARLPDHLASFCWTDSANSQLIRVVFEKESEKFVGLNSLGIRYRHEKFDQWLKAEKSISFVMEHLQEANFDPELFKTHEKEFTEGFRKKFPGINFQFKAKKRFLERLGL